MPYTAAQLTTYYTALTGVAPDTATALSIQAFAAQNAGSTLSDAQALAQTFNLVGVQNSFEVAEATYLFFTGQTTSAAGLAFLEGLPGSGNANGLTTAYYSGAGGTLANPNANPANGAIGFNTENRYYNFAINLATPGGQGAAAFAATYGGLTFAQTVSLAYENIIGSSTVGATAAATAIADITSRQAFFAQIAATRGGDATALTNPNASTILKAVVIGYILEEANKADVGTYARAINQFEAAVAAGVGIYNTNALTTYAPGGAGYNTGVGLGVTNVALTTGPDTLNTTTGNITFIAQVGGAAATLGPSDSINAQGANNTLLVNTTGGTQADASGGALITGVQTVNVRVTDGPGAGGASTGATFSQTAAPNATALNAYLSTGTVAFTNVAGTTSVGLVGNGSVQGGSLVAAYASGTTANVSVSGGTRSFANSGGAATNVAITGATAAVATTVILTSSGQANFLDALTLPAGAATLTINAQQAFTAASVNQVSGVNTLTTLNVTGSGAVDLGTTPFGDALRFVNSTNSAGLRASFTTPAAGTAFTVATAAGAADRITLTNATAQTTVITGGGGDTLRVTGAIAAGASLNGGGGATLQAVGLAYAGLSAFSAAQRAQITGFSNVTITDAGGLTGGQTYDLNLIGATGLSFYGVAAGGTAIVNGASGATLTFLGSDTVAPLNGNVTNNGTVVVLLAGALAATSTNDVLNLNFVDQSASASTSVQIGGVETLNISASRAASAASTAMVSVNIAETAPTPALNTVNITGDERVFFFASNTMTALKAINSTSTTGSLIYVNTATSGTATSPILVTTGAGVDQIGVRDFARITAGAGADTIDVYTPTNSQTYSVFTDAGAGDRLNFITSSYTAPAGTTFAPLSLQATATLQDYLNAATTGTAPVDSSNLGTNPIRYFVFGGNTYVVADISTATTFQNGVDSVIQLVGVHTVTAINNGFVTLGS